MTDCEVEESSDLRPAGKSKSETNCILEMEDRMMILNMKSKSIELKGRRVLIESIKDMPYYSYNYLNENQIVSKREEIPIEEANEEDKSDVNQSKNLSSLTKDKRHTRKINKIFPWIRKLPLNFLTLTSNPCCIQSNFKHPIKAYILKELCLIANVSFDSHVFLYDDTSGYGLASVMQQISDAGARIYQFIDKNSNFNQNQQLKLLKLMSLSSCLEQKRHWFYINSNEANCLDPPLDSTISSDNKDEQMPKSKKLSSDSDLLKDFEKSSGKNIVSLLFITSQLDPNIFALNHMLNCITTSDCSIAIFCYYFETMKVIVESLEARNDMYIFEVEEWQPRNMQAIRGRTRVDYSSQEIFGFVISATKFKSEKCD